MCQKYEIDFVFWGKHSSVKANSLGADKCSWSSVQSQMGLGLNSLPCSVAGPSAALREGALSCIVESRLWGRHPARSQGVWHMLSMFLPRGM